MKQQKGKTMDDLEQNFITWNEYWMLGCYDPHIEADLWEAEQGEVIYGKKESRTEKPTTTKGTI